MSSFGEELRRERELREISLREVAEATKVNVRYLEALERNDFQHLPGGVFNRGFVRAYSQFIGVDPETMVNAYLLEERTQGSPLPPAESRILRGKRSGERGGRPSGEPQPGSRSPSRSLLRWSLVVILFTILVVAGLFLAERYWSPGSGDEAGERRSEVGGE